MHSLKTEKNQTVLKNNNIKTLWWHDVIESHSMKGRKSKTGSNSSSLWETNKKKKKKAIRSHVNQKNIYAKRIFIIGMPQCTAQKPFKILSVKWEENVFQRQLLCFKRHLIRFGARLYAGSVK